MVEVWLGDRMCEPCVAWESDEHWLMFPPFERDVLVFCQLHVEIHCLFILIIFQLEAEAQDSRGK